jgi:hypothetical protein
LLVPSSRTQPVVIARSPIWGVRVEGAGIADPDDRARPELDQLLEEHRGAGRADAVGGGGERNAVLRARDDRVLADDADGAPLVPAGGDAGDAGRIAADEDLGGDVAGGGSR